MSLRVAMVGPKREVCGVQDYAQYQLESIAPLVDSIEYYSPEEFRFQKPDADVVHVQHQYFVFGGVAPWKNRFRQFAASIHAPCVMTVHEIVEPEGSYARRTAIEFVNHQQFLNPKMQRLIVHTAQDSDRLLNMGVDPARIVEIPHGVPKCPPLIDPEQAKRTLGVEGRFVVTLFGFLSAKKGHSIAIEALKLLPDDLFLLIAGGRHPDDFTEYPKKLEVEAANPEIAQRIRITGYLNPEAVSQALSATDMIIAPFINTSGSGSLAMAFAAGKPIAASDIPPFREIADRGTDSLMLFESNNPTALAESILELKNDESKRHAFTAGSSVYGNSWSYNRTAELTVEVYKRAIQEARR